MQLEKANQYIHRHFRTPLLENIQKSLLGTMEQMSWNDRGESVFQMKTGCHWSLQQAVFRMHVAGLCFISGWSDFGLVFNLWAYWKTLWVCGCNVWLESNLFEDLYKSWDLFLPVYSWAGSLAAHLLGYRSWLKPRDSWIATHIDLLMGIWGLCMPVHFSGPSAHRMAGAVSWCGSSCHDHRVSRPRGPGMCPFWRPSPCRTFVVCVCPSSTCWYSEKFQITNSALHLINRLDASSDE